MTAPDRSAGPRLVLIMALITSSGAGCNHSRPPAATQPQPVADACVNMDALLHGATTARCTLAQRLCLLLGDLPAALAQEDFVPELSFTIRWLPHVQAWNSQLDEIGKTPELEPYAHAVRRKIDLLGRNQNDRRLTITDGDLLHALQVLGQKSAAVVPGPGLGCTLPQ